MVVALGFPTRSRLTCSHLALALIDLVHTTEIWTTNRRTRRGQLPLALAVPVLVCNGQSWRSDRITRMLCGDRQWGAVHGQYQGWCFERVSLTYHSLIDGLPSAFTVLHEETRLGHGDHFVWRWDRGSCMERDRGKVDLQDWTLVDVSGAG